MGIACCKGPAIDDNAEGTSYSNNSRVVAFQFTSLSWKGSIRKSRRISNRQVRVVQHKGNKNIYALKYINKQKCLQMSAVDNIIEERKLLEAIFSNFVW